ncbi:MAG: 6-bladed beta-propeller [Chryseolinea sp.]
MTSRRNFIRQSTLTTAAVLAQPAISFSIGHKDIQPDESIIGHGAFKYKVDKGWAKMSVTTNPLLNCHEMVQDRKGRLIMLGDHTKNNILIFDKSGKLLDFWGSAFPGGHGLSISHEGEDDFLVITDCGYFQNRIGNWDKQAGQVVKMTVDGKLVFAIGHPRSIGVYKDNEPFMPTETAVAANGDIYVADGYGSDYILQYDRYGKYIRHFAGHNNANKEHNLINAHGVAIDRRDPNNPILICTSREENCFKFFSLDGKYLKRIDLPGMYVCRPVIDDKNIYAGVCWSKDKTGNRFSNSGFVTILDQNNKVVSSPGGTEPVYNNGVLQPTLQESTPAFQHGHDVCVDDEKNVYVCQWNANYSSPVKLTRVG